MGAVFAVGKGLAGSWGGLEALEGSKGDWGVGGGR